MDECKPLISGSRFEGLTADEVEHDVRHADLVYDGVLDSFNRKWRQGLTLVHFQLDPSTACRSNLVMLVPETA